MKMTKKEMDNKSVAEDGFDDGASRDFESLNDPSEHHHRQKEEDRKAEREMAVEILKKRDRHAVLLLSAFTLGLLLVVALCICLFVYFYIKQNQEAQYQAAFEEQGVKLLDVLATRLDERVRAIEFFGLSLMSNTLALEEAASTNFSWTDLYLPHMEMRGNLTNKLADAISLTILPVVTAENRLEYENFAQEKQGWRAEGMAFQQKWANEEWVSPADWVEQAGFISQSIAQMDHEYQGMPVPWSKNGTVDATGPGPFLPSWQAAPSLSDPSITNLDMLSHPAYQRVLQAGLTTGRLILGDTYVPFVNATQAAKYGILKMYIDRYVQQEDNVYIDDPVTDLVYPIHDGFFGESKVVGLVHAHLGWRSFFTNALPEGDGPLIATLHSECSDMYTYYVDGPNVEYIGFGGNHDTADTKTKFARDFHTFDKVFNVPDEERADGECFYMFHVHAALEMKPLYVNNDAIIFALIIGAVFVFTSLVFISYDHAVKRNQNKVMQSALRSGAIVSSLFPKAVRDRLYQSSEKQKDAGKGSAFRNNEQNPLNRTQSLLGSTHGEDCLGGGLDDVSNSDPVADLYPNCTVLFTDIAGFTKWSAERSPVEVFKLLETLYGQFDRIAKRRKVFKVETIGDCYVAITGCPEAQSRHAVIMVRFAFDCMAVMNQVFSDLVPILGADTMNLNMRFGLHSGPVTAGVLRGDKSRFQLFGDTVNTAARMESNGQKGRIHVSEATANLLKEAGHDDWISPREELVEAKGKGSLQTYWVAKSVFSEGQETMFTTGGSFSGEGTDHDDESVCPDTERYDI